MRNREGPGVPRRAGIRTRRFVLAWMLAALVFATHAALAQQHGAAPARRAAPTSIEEENYEILRRLLGVGPPSTVPDEPAEESRGGAVEKEPEPAPPQARQAPQPAPPAAAEPVAAQPAPPPKPEPPVDKKTTGRAASSKPTSKPTAKPAAAPAPTDPGPRRAATTAKTTATPARQAQATRGVPAPGAALTAADLDRWKHLMGPSIQWAIGRGATLRVAAPTTIPMGAARTVATERYHARVELTADKTDMKNYVAGIPFPSVAPADPDAGIKVMLNQQSRITVDDLDVRNIACEGGRIVDGQGFTIEKRYVTEHWRRLSYVGRLYNDPKPSWNTIDGVRHRESQYPFIEPVDLKGGGWTYTRYLDAARLDEVWLFNPSVGRVRRMSTAQRSQGMFGQDMDIDSLSGFSANPAWTQWRCLGTKTILAPMHASQTPAQWQRPPSDFLFDEAWEPREVYVIVGRSRLPEYGSADRVIYVDRESYLIPYSEIYDMKGQLWRALVLAWNFQSEVRADLGGATVEEPRLPGYTMIDMEIAHVTRCELPQRETADVRSWYHDYGAAGGVTPESFATSNFIEEPR
ncbi:MAG: DUF1329 domain-containing protein [Deltaproteobacteria bacterium]|nr:DUF1329 domain-containing protein [Deltaproteobacteria bacterium]